MNFLRIASVLLLWPMPAAVPGVGSATFLEGSVRLLRGTSVLSGAEGMRLRPGDILETPDKGFVQLEFTSGTVVALGPASRLYLFRRGAGHEGAKGGEVAGEFVLLSGWLKAESNASVGANRYESHLLSVTVVSGSTVVVHAYDGGCDVFVESGSATIGEVSPDGNSRQPVSAKPGQFFSRKTGKSISSSSRPDPAFLSAMPAAFRDTLPSRLARFVGKVVEPRTDHQATYTEVQPWLTMAPGWRRGLVDRFTPRLKDPEFRKELEAHLGSHPEWDAILHPEKQPPEAAPVPTPKP
jgi:hypothetical protein